ncbi:neuronal acetylcholine receptor subunit beta-3-like [Physella acuta]|uniref:neuronal acetylcholine receptor subunit beta-3-like n=1 Tax=Physella acuta TaxID=109671 RepID=UPI0027DE7961|nr:neuronal acetylcholine receptor subunit beta-3-like [Physella acuta]
MITKIDQIKLKQIWRDELMIWNPDKYGGIKDIVLPQKSLWRPDIAIFNGIEKVFLGAEELQIFVTSDGQVRWEPITSLGVACSVDITKYPFDQTLCFVNVTSWMNDESTINLTANSYPVNLKSLVPNKEFYIWSDGIEITRNNYYRKIYKWINFKIRLERRPTYLIITLLMPIMLLAVLSVFSFFLSPEETEKVSLAITILLSFTVFLSVIDNDLPQTSDHISLLVVYIVLLLLFSFLSVAGNALVIIVHRRDMKKNVEGSAAKVEINKQGELTESLTEKDAQLDSDYNHVEFLPPVSRWKVYTVFLLVFSFLAIAGNALVIIVHRRDKKKNVEGRAAEVEGNKEGELTASLTSIGLQVNHNNTEFLASALAYHRTSPRPRLSSL